MIFIRKISFWLAAAGLIAATVLVLQLRAAYNQPPPPPPIVPPTDPYPRGGIAASGLVEARQQNTNVGVPQAGFLTMVRVKVWDRVEAGAPLLQLDDSELRAQLPAQEANVAVAQAQMARLQDQLDRMESVHDPRVVSVDDLKTREHDVAVAAAQLGAARAVVAQTRLLIDRLTVRAPIAGTILQVNCRTGENVVMGASPPPIVMGNIGDVQVRADVDEQLAPRVKAGKNAIGFLKGDATRPIAMEFAYIEPYIIPKVSLTGAPTERVDTRVLQVIFTFKNNPGREVYVGQQLDLYIEE